MKCPTCKDSVLSISERKGIEIDYCPQCRGVWLDRGELDKILEKSSEESNAIAPQSAPPQAYQNPMPGPYQAPYQKPYKRRKSFLEELFD